MQKCRTVIGLFVIASVMLLGGTAAAESTFHGTFVLHFGRGAGASNAPCAADTFCGVGNLAGYGRATDTLDFTSFEEIEGTTCSAVTVTETIDLVDGSGELVLDEVGTFCSPGGSDAAPLPPSNQDYGHPHTMTTTYTVDTSASTGVFAGATGSGTSSFVTSGDVAVWGPSGS